jgi:hypothetical protein
MLRDVFYFNQKPNVHPREKFATSVEDARSQCTTEHFWIVNEYCDYRNFDWDWDFEFLSDEDVWVEEHNNVWPSNHQKDSGTWLCSSCFSEVIIYRADVNPLTRNNEKNNNWVLLDLVDKTKFDFSWHPDPTDSPYIYTWGCKFFPVELQACLEYHAPNATNIKYMSEIIELLPQTERWIEIQEIDKTLFDMSWRPDPREPPYIYVWGNKHIDGTLKSTLEYHMPDATDTKYMPNLISVLPEWDRWIIPNDIDRSSFDFSWRPDPREPNLIYEFATQWQKTGGPRYVMDGATEIKYLDIQKAKALPNKNNFEILYTNVIDEFDYSWHPDSTDEPYIYVFGNNLYPAEVMPTIQYVPSTVTRLASSKAIGQIKYVSDIIAILGENKINWEITQQIDEQKFDFSWAPNPKDPPYIYVWGNKHIDGTLKSTLEYHMPNATEYKYMEELIDVVPEWDRWIIPNDIDRSSFDFSWRPDPREPNLIYLFATQWQKTGGPRYVMDGATEIKYLDIQKAKVKASSDRSNWAVLHNLKIKDFDYSWHPDATEEPFIYVFGNTQYPSEIMDTIEYRMPNATNLKYISKVVARLDVDMNGWTIPERIDISKFDFSWKPNPKDPAFIYQFGTQWQKTGGPRYVVESATEVKYIDTYILKAVKLPCRENFKIPDEIAVAEFDFSWHPDDNETPYLYQFGTQWQKTGGPTYIVENAAEIKYIALPKAKKLPSKMNWVNPSQSEVNTFDYSWHPDETVPPYIYQFGTLLNKEDGPRYMSPKTNGEIVHLERTLAEVERTIETITRYVITTTLEDLVKQHPNEIFWAMHKNIDYTTFNFDWRPEIVNVQWENEYVYVFGSLDSEITQTYFVNANMYLKGNQDFKFIQTAELTEKYLATLFKKSDMFFVDRSNNESTERFEKLKQQFPNIQKTRYLGSWVDTINRCINRSTTDLCWILNSELDYSNFNFEYYPNPWQMKMIQVFGTQWGNWGTTFMVNRETFSQDTKYIKNIEHLSNLNFVKDRKAMATNVLYDIVYIDHGNVDVSTLKDNIVIKYQNSYIITFQKLLDILPVKKEHYVWIASTVCDYTNFDFTYICDPFAKEQLHVFPSDKQKFGDTFLVDVNKLRTLIVDMNVLEDYKKINYNQSQRAKRLPAPIIFTESDTHVSTIDIDFNFPYATFLTVDNKEIQVIDTEPMSLWTPEAKSIQITSVGGTRIVVPKEAKEYVKRELYDYPYIITNSRLAKSSPMDIVFLSNGEIGAEENYQHLLKVTQDLPNRVTRVDGVNGRVAAYHAAAAASNTPWLFTVFAKLKVSNKFDWNWQPDRLQESKSYVFHAKNPVNGLIYGHQSLICYNKKLVLDQHEYGIDFTLSMPHEVVPLLSGTANYNTDPYATWRTAFREVTKLRDQVVKNPADDISALRLETWLNKAEGEFSQWSIKGAVEAEEYYEEVEGNYEKLLLSFEWVWLKELFNAKHGSLQYFY